jgi:DNA-binding IclR family transcriptional regulator
MTWTFLTTHAQVLICLAQACDTKGQTAITIRSIAQQLGVTERHVLRTIDDLAASGYVAVGREGRRNVYTVRRGLPLRSAVLPGRTVGALLAVFVPEAEQRVDES